MTAKKSRDQGTLTNCQVQREREVKTEKESQPASSTHHLSSAEGGTSHYRESQPASQRHSHAVEHIGRDKSGQ